MTHSYDSQEDEEYDGPVRPEDVAGFMEYRVLEAGEKLYQKHTVNIIREHFGEEFLYSDEHGRPRIAKSVLKVFNARTKDTVGTAEGLVST